MNIKEDSRLQIIDYYAFANSSIQYFNVPSKVIEIGDGTFCNCKKLQNVHFNQDSKLKTVGKKAFASSSIEIINCPINLISVGEKAFHVCKKLIIADFNSSENLQTIGKEAFAYSSVEKILFHPQIEIFKDKWHLGTEKLKDIMIDICTNNPNFIYLNNEFIIGKSIPQNDAYDILYFAKRDIKKAIIPAYIKKIASYAFYNCQKLTNVEIPNNSELQIIDEGAFYCSSIESISIPPHVKSICDYAFSNCKYLKKIEIPQN